MTAEATHAPPVREAAPAGDRSSVAHLRNVTKYFEVGGRLLGRGKRTVRAVDDVTLEIPYGSTLGLVGESGSGKSTLARLVVRLIDVSAGTIEFEGRDITNLSGPDLRRWRRDVQMVYQDPFSSFDPTSPLASTVAEPLTASGVKKSVAEQRVAELFDLVSLRPAFMARYPHEMSGGQLQRAAIARGLITEPKLLVLDEPISALDVSTQAQILNLLADLQDRIAASYLFVTHNLAVAQHVCDRIAVLHLGRLVETGPTDRIYNHPLHPYTAALISAVPSPDPRPDRRGSKIILDGDLPSPISPPSGCTFRTRCPWAMPICAEEEPAPLHGPDGSVVFCHLHSTGPELLGASVTELATPVTVRR